MVVDFKGSPPMISGGAVSDSQACKRKLMTLHILLDDWHRPTNQVVRAQMVPSVARVLAERLAMVAGP
jgi:hypothetical protein